MFFTNAKKKSKHSADTAKTQEDDGLKEQVQMEPATKAGRKETSVRATRWPRELPEFNS